MLEKPETLDQAAYRTIEGVAVQILARSDSSECVLRGGSSLFLPRHLGASVLVGSTVRCSVAAGSGASAGEVLIFPPTRKGPATLRGRIGGTARPRKDQRGQPFLTAPLEQKGLGIERVYISGAAVRDYFYAANRQLQWNPIPTFYEVLHVPEDIPSGELRLAFNLACLERETHGGGSKQNARLERAFNILGQPDLRACYDSLLADPEATVLFPYGGCGTLTGAGYLSPDGTVFFCHRIVAFFPDIRARRIRVPIRRLTFLDQHAHYKDSRHHVEALFDRAVLRLDWESSWNQWKHLLGADVVVEAEFTQHVRWRRSEGKLEPIRWESPLPSRLTITLPDDVNQQIHETRKRFHELGNLSDAVETIRVRLESEAIELSELRRIFKEVCPASDFDPCFINWQPNYDRYFYGELCRRADRPYLFRKEYIFETKTMLIIEIPSRGHATYLFVSPKKFSEFMAHYTNSTKDDIRTNRNGIAEKLGFVARIIHGRSRRQWLRVLQLHLGEAARGDA